jgi:asparagine synthase (glutamine-hydrolysing)
MCGIAGHSLCGRTMSKESLERMLALLRHRGPDDQGIWCGAAWQVGMTRLSIIDLECGQQPMVSHDGRWVIVMNGEIYNFRTLRRQLEAQGLRLRTHSDTEVFLELVARHGLPETLRRAEGMFAVCCVDTSSGDLWLARDRFGEKPLFIDRREGGFVFCSELNPLLEVNAAARRICARGVISILRFGYPWPNVTAIEEIVSLEPGSWLRRGVNGSEDCGRYWEPPDRVDEARHSIAKCGTELLTLLEASVSDRLVADVPVGLFLSGGIDSGSVAVMVQRQGAATDAVNVGFKEASYNERPLAKKTAEFLGLRLLEEEGSIDPFTPDYFDELIRHHGQPFYDTSAVPTRAVSRAARRRFKVVLSGDGGDELLGGYLAHSRNARLHGPGMWAIRELMPTGNFLENLWGRRGERLARGMGLVASVRQGLLPHVMAGVFSDQMILKLTEGTAWARAAKEHLEEAQAESRALWFAAKDIQLALSHYQLRHSLPEEILTKVDRMSMAESLEVRAPFLDSRFAAYALSIPAHLKVRDGVGKFVLREALKGLLPEAVLTAPKRGFALPVRSWLGSSFWRCLDAEVQRYEHDDDCELNPEELKACVKRDLRICSECNDYRALHRAVLLYGFLRWRQTYIRADRTRSV